MNMPTPVVHRQYRDYVREEALQAFAEAGIDECGLQRLKARNGAFRKYLVSGIRQFSGNTPDYAQARSILGSDFISPEEVMAVRSNVVYGYDNIARLAETLPSPEVFNSLKVKGFGLVPHPPYRLTVPGIWAVKPSYFNAKTYRWLGGSPFLNRDHTGSGWLAIRKKLVDRSRGALWAERNKLLSESEFVPNAPEVCWFASIFSEVRGVRLFAKVYVRTSSIGFDSVPVRVGRHTDEGLRVCCRWGSSRRPNVGLVSAWKL